MMCSRRRNIKKMSVDEAWDGTLVDLPDASVCTFLCLWRLHMYFKLFLKLLFFFCGDGGQECQANNMYRVRAVWEKTE